MRQIQEDAKSKAKSARTPEKPQPEKENAPSLREQIAKSNPLVMKMLSERQPTAPLPAEPLPLPR